MANMRVQVRRCRIHNLLFFYFFSNTGMGSNRSYIGRFFVSDQLKILIAFYILKYDFRYEPGTSRLPVIEYEQHFIANPANKIQAKIRREELDLLSPKVL